MNGAAARRKQGLNWFRFAVAVLVVVVAVHAAIYIITPFPDFWNNFLSNFFTVLAALLSAVAATLVWQRYEKAEPPRRVWRWLAIALWLWTIAEVIWAYENMTLEEVPIGWPDVFWVFAYILLGLALYRQFILLYHPDPALARRRLFYTLLAFVALTLLSTFFFSFFTRQSFGLEVFVNAFYPAGDFAVGLAGLWLARRFRNGALAYAWLGLFVFTIADLLYTWLDLTGMYAWSVSQKSPLSTITDITYMAAYLTVALGCFTQWLVLNYGPIFKKEFHES